MALKSDLGLYSSLELGPCMALCLREGRSRLAARPRGLPGAIQPQPEVGRSPRSNPFDSEAYPCRSCGGRGQTLGRTCFVCDGTGRRPVGSDRPRD